MMNITKNKNSFQRRKEKYLSFYKERNDYSNTVALEGFSEKEVDTIFNSLQKIRKNIEKDWEFVKRETREIIDCIKE